MLAHDLSPLDTTRSAAWEVYKAWTMVFYPRCNGNPEIEWAVAWNLAECGGC